MTNANDPTTYEGGPHNADCYKHNPGESTPHGYITQDGKSVVLNLFDQSWPGDHWETLVVKGGDGRTIEPHPIAGTTYEAPLNGGGNVPDVSHWIVCKGTTPDTPPPPPPPPTPSPSPSPSPEPTPTPSPTPDPSPTPGVEVPTTPPELANTGLPVGVETSLWVVLGLVVAGIIALWVRKVRA